MRKHLSTLALSISFLLSAHGTQSMAQSNPTFMQLGRAKSALYKPDSGPEPHVGIIVMHRESNCLNNVRLRRICQARLHGLMHELAL